MSSRGGKDTNLKVRAIRLRNDSSLFLSVDTVDGTPAGQLDASRVGKKVRVYSPVDRKWHAGAIVDYQEGQGAVYHKIIYSNGKVSWIDLTSEKVLIDDDGNLNATVANPDVNKRAVVQTRKSGGPDEARDESETVSGYNQENKRAKKMSRGKDKRLSSSSSVRKMSCAGEVIEPAALREAVNHCGGYDEVVLRRHWQKVRERLGIRFVSSAGYQLRKAYEKYFFSNNIDEQMDWTSDSDTGSGEEVEDKVSEEETLLREEINELKDRRRGLMNEMKNIDAIARKTISACEKKVEAAKAQKATEDKRRQEEYEKSRLEKRKEEEGRAIDSSSSTTSDQTSETMSATTARVEPAAVDQEEEPLPEYPDKKNWEKSVVITVLDPTIYLDLTKRGLPWCRYCGARSTSGWQRGPWGKKSLCIPHYVAWWQKKTLDLKEELGKPFPTQPLNPSVNTEFKYEAWKKYKARKDEVYLLRRQIVDKRLQRKNKVNTKEEDAEFVKFEQAEIAKNEKLGRRVSSRAIRNKFESMKKAKQDEVRKIQILKHEEAAKKEKEEQRRVIALQRQCAQEEQQLHREQRKHESRQKQNREKLLKLDRSITALEGKVAKCKAREEESKKQRKIRKKTQSKRSWHEISSQENDDIHMGDTGNHNEGKKERKKRKKKKKKKKKKKAAKRARGTTFTNDDESTEDEENDDGDFARVPRSAALSSAVGKSAPVFDGNVGSSLGFVWTQPRRG